MLPLCVGLKLGPVVDAAMLPLPGLSSVAMSNLASSCVEIAYILVTS